MPHFLTVKTCEHGDTCDGTRDVFCPGYGDIQAIECTEPHNADCRWSCTCDDGIYWINHHFSPPRDLSPDGQAGCGARLKSVPCNVQGFLTSTHFEGVADQLERDQEGLRAGRHEITATWDEESYEIQYVDIDRTGRLDTPAEPNRFEQLVESWIQAQPHLVDVEPWIRDAMVQLAWATDQVVTAPYTQTIDWILEQAEEARYRANYIPTEQTESSARYHAMQTGIAHALERISLTLQLLRDPEPRYVPLPEIKDLPLDDDGFYTVHPKPGQP